MDILKLYIKTFIFFALVIGVSFFLIFHYVEPGYSVDTSMIGAFIGATIGGGIITLFVASKQIGQSGVMPLHAKSQFLLDLDLHASFNKCLEVLRNLGFKIDQAEDVFISASSGMKINSAGEKVVINLASKSPNKTAVQISSKPKFFLNFIDSGTNYMNVKKISDALKITS